MITHSPSSPTYRRLKFAITEVKKKNYGFFKPTDEVYQAWEKTESIAKILKATIIVFQCPASFQPTPENKRNLEKFFNTIKRKDYVFVWEPRGKWERKEISAICKKLDLLPRVEPFNSEPFPGKIGYFRLHGRTGYRYKYTDSDLKELEAKTKGFDLVYFMFNNVYMFEDALNYKQMIVG